MNGTALTLNFMSISIPTICLSLCLFGFWFFLVYRPTRDLFHFYDEVAITNEGLHILIYARHPWPFSSEASLTCHTYCDTDLPFIIVIPEVP